MSDLICFLIGLILGGGAVCLARITIKSFHVEEEIQKLKGKINYNETR